jgi:hypothetical protein
MKKVGYICRTHICKLPHQNHWYGVFLIFVSFYFQELNASKQKELAENQRAVQAEQVVIISSLFDQFTVVFLYSDEP